MPYSAADVMARPRILRMLLVAPAKHGKAQPIDEPVLTPTGWRPIGDLCEGDQIVGSDGHTARVTGVFPQGRREVFRVATDDGGWTRCCDEHLWFTTTETELARGRWRKVRIDGKKTSIATGIFGSGSVKPLADIRSDVGSRADDAMPHYIPRVASVEFAPRAKLPLDPYYLGALIGDGGLTGNSAVFNSTDEEMLSAVEGYAIGLGDLTRRIVHPEKCPQVRIARPPGKNASTTVEILRSIDVMGKRSQYKHIPPEYMLASREDRLALLRGLLDSDGSVTHSGRQVQYCTTSPQLRDGVIDLVHSLGGRAYSYMKHTYRLDAYIVLVSFVDDVCPFRLKRKADLWLGSSKKTRRRRIASIEPSGEAECVCISVDTPDQLYVTRNFILTHNTTSCCMTAPRPIFIFNTDGKGALDPVASLGGDFAAEDITGLASFERAFAWLMAHINDFETVILDNLTGFSSMLEAEVRVDVGRDDPRVIYPEHTRRLMKCIDKLLNLERNVIIIGHAEAGENDTPGGFGHILGIAGKAKTMISMKIQDWVWLHVEVSGDTVKRQFLLAPSGNWNKAARSIQNIPRMDADVAQFITLMEKGGVPAKKKAPVAGAQVQGPPVKKPVVNGTMKAPAR